MKTVPKSGYENSCRNGAASSCENMKNNLNVLNVNTVILNSEISCFCYCSYDWHGTWSTVKRKTNAYHKICSVSTWIKSWVELSLIEVY